ncbi:hypothetical protein [Mycetohabitans sp. B2]|uniref:hypothetical protein n=1 Tax=Mycetohabitans sp. B2 TaxID=2841274 RepID=UPI003FA5EF10
MLPSAYSGIAREALYKAPRPGSEPRFETISHVCVALGVCLSTAATLTEFLGFRPHCICDVLRERLLFV